MLRNMWELAKGPLGRSMRLLALALGLIFVIAACGVPEGVAPAPTAPATPDAESVAPEPTATATPDTERVAPAPTATAAPDKESVAPAPTLSATPDTESVALEPTPEHAIISAELPPEHYGASIASVEKRIYLSNTIVRASLQSTGPDLLRFRAIEYLKGSGAAEFVVHASTNRNTAWDDREAVLFLSLPETGAAGASEEAASANFYFTDTDEYYTGDYPGGYTIDRRNPTWLPLQATAGPRGAEDNGVSDPTFITDSAAATGGSPSTISLSDLRAKIAWVEGGEDVEDIETYEQCISFSIGHQLRIRDWEAYYGRPWSPHQLEKRIPSGAREGILLDDDYYRDGRDREYHRFWLSGQDADLFRTHIVDDDAVASNGFVLSITTVRPLPGGMYRLFRHVRPSVYWPCNYAPDESYTEDLITAFAPESAVHEAFFDPVAIGGAVGADAANGVLKPASFSLTEEGSTASLKKIAWESGRVAMELEPSFSLAGHHADFIALDSSVSLRLDFDDAAEMVDGAKVTLAWNVCAQPWESGDRLMLRISRSREGLTGVTNDGPCNTPPPAPLDLRAQATHDSVTLTWDAPDDPTVTGYRVLRRRPPEQRELAVHVEDTATTTTTYLDTQDVLPGTKYIYRVQAINEAGVGAASDPAQVTTAAPAPLDLAAQATHDSVTLTWSAPADAAVTGYRVLRRAAQSEDTFGHVADVAATVTAHLDADGVAAGTRYIYRVLAMYDAVAGGAARVAVTTNPAP